MKERILTIRLMEKAKANPAQAQVLGIVVVTDAEKPDQYRLADGAAERNEQKVRIWNE